MPIDGKGAGHRTHGSGSAIKAADMFSWLPGKASAETRLSSAATPELQHEYTSVNLGRSDLQSCRQASWAGK
jgi:hypothetical protein